MTHASIPTLAAKDPHKEDMYSQERRNYSMAERKDDLREGRKNDTHAMQNHANWKVLKNAAKSMQHVKWEARVQNDRFQRPCQRRKIRQTCSCCVPHESFQTSHTHRNSLLPTSKNQSENTMPSGQPAFFTNFRYGKLQNVANKIFQFEHGKQIRTKYRF